MSRGGASAELPVECVRFLLSDQAAGLTGKTLSARFDPWKSEEFRTSIAEINNSDLYTLRRINLVNLPDGPIKTALSSVTLPDQRVRSNKK
jgi:hypothetical protein